MINMTNTNINNEILNKEQLNQVAGGTRKELDELISAVVDNSFLSGVEKGASRFIEFSGTVKDAVIKDLDKAGIKATIDTGYIFGIGEKNNTYIDKVTGQSLTHAQALDKIKAYSAAH